MRRLLHNHCFVMEASVARAGAGEPVLREDIIASVMLAVMVSLEGHNPSIYL